MSSACERVNDECLNQQTQKKTKFSKAFRAFNESKRNASLHFVKMGTKNESGHWPFQKLIDKWWSPVQVKSVSKGKQKQDISIEPLGNTNIIRFTKFMHKFATSLNEWVLLGKTGLSKEKIFRKFFSKDAPLIRNKRTLLCTE